MILSLFLLSLSLYRLKISTSVERSSVAPPCAPVTSPPQSYSSPSPYRWRGTARLIFSPPSSLCPFFVSQLHVGDANSPSVTKKRQHDHARSYHPLLIPHLRTISVVPPARCECPDRRDGRLGVSEPSRILPAAAVQ